MTTRAPDASSKENGARAVLVTGGAGYIGSHTCKALAQAGYLPVSYDNFVHGHRWAVQWGPSVDGDLSDMDLLVRTLERYQVQAVLHFAGYCYVGESMSEPAKYFRNNMVNSMVLLEAMRKVGVDKVVFSSTCATYGTPETMPIGEDHTQLPINPYGESKLVVEKMLRWWEAAHGLRWMALRYFNAAGADADGELGEDHDPETHLIPLCIKAALGEREGVDLYGTDYPTRDGSAIRDYIHVTDLADAHVRALKTLVNTAKSAALNLGTGAGHSVREVMAMVREVSRCDFPVRVAPRRTGDPPELVANAKHAFATLAWAPKHSDLRTIVETAWDWHAKHHSKVARDSDDSAAMEGKH